MEVVQETLDENNNMNNNNDDNDDDILQKSSPGKRSFSDMDTEPSTDFASAVVVLDNPASESKRAKTDSSLFSKADEYDVPWSTYDYNVKLLVKRGDGTLVVLRCHTTQLVLFRYFQLMFKEEWSQKYERFREIDLSSSVWHAHTWSAVLSCCYRRAALKPRTLIDTEFYVLFKPDELTNKEMVSSYFKLEFDLLCFLNAVDKNGLWEASLEKKNVKYLKSFAKMFLLTSDVTDHQDLMLFKELFSHFGVFEHFAVQALDMAVNCRKDSTCLQILRWAFLAVALTEEAPDWSRILSILRNLRDFNKNEHNMELEQLLYQIAIFCPEKSGDEEAHREYIAGDKTNCLRTAFFKYSKDKRWTSRSDGPIVYEFHMKPDFSANDISVAFEDEDYDDDGSFLDLKRYFTIQPRDSKLYIYYSNYAHTPKSFRLKWREPTNIIM